MRGNIFNKSESLWHDHTERPLFSFVLLSVSDSMDYSIFNIYTMYYNYLVDVFFRNPTVTIMSSNDKNESALLGQVVLI